MDRRSFAEVPADKCAHVSLLAPDLYSLSYTTALVNVVLSKPESAAGLLHGSPVVPAEAEVARASWFAVKP